MADHVDDVAVGGAYEEAAHAPWLARERVHDLIAAALRLPVGLNRLLLGPEPLVEARWHGDLDQEVDYDPDCFDRWVRHANPGHPEDARLEQEIDLRTGSKRPTLGSGTSTRARGGKVIQ